MQGASRWGTAVVGVVVVFALGVVLGSRQQSAATPAAAQTAECSVATLNGSYGVTFEGKSRALGQFASVSLWTFDGRGGMTAQETFSSEMQNGGRAIAGSYSVQPDCTFTLTFPSELVRTHDVDGVCVVVDGGRQFSCLDSEEGWVALGTGRKT